GTGNTTLGCRTVNVTPAAVGHLDSVSFVPGQGVRLAGWAADFDAPTTPVDVHVYINGSAYDLGTASLSRPDVDNAYPDLAPNHGFDVTVPFTSEGTFSACAYAINIGRGVTNPPIGCSPVQLQYNPIGSLDSATFVPGQGIRIRGWIADPD